MEPTICPICMTMVGFKITKMLTEERDNYQFTETVIRFSCGHVQEMTSKINIEIEKEILEVTIEE